MKNNKGLSTSIILLVIIYLLHDMPALGMHFPYYIYILLVLLLFILLIPKINFSTFLKLSVVFIFPVINSITSFLLDFNLYRFVLDISGLIQVMIYALLGIIIVQTNDIKSAKLIIRVFLTISIITAITTYIGCRIYPGASRALAVTNVEDMEYYNIYTSMNIGGFSFIYSIVFLVPLLIVLMKNQSYFKNSKLVFLMSLCSLIVIGLAVFSSEYTLAVLLFLFSLSLLFFTRRLSAVKLLTLTILSVSLFLLFKPIFGEMLVGFSANLTSENISSRLFDIGVSVQGEEIIDNNSAMNIRMEKYMKSFNSFVSNPFGTWFFKKPEVGGHSFILDNMARYGIFAIFLFILMIRQIYRLYLLKFRQKSYYGYGLIMLFMFIVLSVVNPGLFFVQLTFVMPLFFFLLTHKKIN